MKNFKELSINDFEINPFTLIGDEWMLITAGNRQNFNTMTASWGTFGILWNKPVAICFVRPQRYTFEFIEKSEGFTLSFFGPENRNILNFCGANSGRDRDKIKETGLVPVVTNRGNVIFEQNTMAVECEKLYSGKLSEHDFLVKSVIPKYYSKNDFHNFYIGEVKSIWKKK